MVKEMKENKSYNTIMNKSKKSSSNSVKTRKGLWSPEEDEKLMSYMLSNGHGCWSDIARNAGLQRCGKSCRLRWINYLRPDLKHGAFSPQEEALILHLHSILGNRWSQIAARLPGRTDNEIKNFWNSNIKKRLKTNNFHPSFTCSQNEANGPFSTSSIPELDPINGSTSVATMPTIHDHYNHQHNLTSLSTMCKESFSSSASSYTSSPSSLHPAPLSTYNTLLESLSHQVLLGNNNIDNEMIMNMDGIEFGGFNVGLIQDKMGANARKGFNGCGGVYGFWDGDDNCVDNKIIRMGVEKDIFVAPYSLGFNTGVDDQYYHANEATTMVETDATKATNSPIITCNNIGDNNSFEIQQEQWPRIGEWDFETLLLEESVPFLEFQA